MKAMHEDGDLAHALGAAPGQIDPRFRLAVTARVLARAQKKRALRQALVFAALLAVAGLAIPLARLSGVAAADAQAALSLGGILALALGGAMALILGPKAALGRALRFVRIAA
jgi:hypothetical protein